MQTNYKTINQENVLSSVSSLPIFRGMSKDDLVIGDEATSKVIPKNIVGTTLALGVLGGSGYLLWTYVLPTIMTILGYTIGMVASGALILFALAMYPVYKRWLSFTAFTLQQKLIENNPFVLLQQQRQEYMKSNEMLSRETANIKALQEDSENKAYQNEVEAKEHRENIQKYTARAEKYKHMRDELVAKIGEDQAKEEDEYYDLESKMMTSINDASRAESLFNQKSRFVEVYGARGLVFKKLFFTLTKAKNNVTETLKDFDLSIKMLEDEYASSADAKRATQTAKNALGLTSKMEVELALKVVNSTITKNISQTVANLHDIADMTKNINSIDNPEEQLERLNQLNAKIENGTMFIPSAKTFKNVDKKFTQQEKMNAGAFGLLK